ncbi:hypothetical protein C9J22_18310 [Photobacterium phosphoreum]|uniref:hypothetical protein n=1 Tax=Photobacterium phosphoreum TaxID=659 RepID=UPI000D15EE3B|nr:hypothetical protein [Photobacterium phosphoreum]PSU68070.1 hypothetical protein C9J22_18310 [Photobacterium phosphoreum]
MISIDKKISVLSLLSAIFKIFGGPITLIFIAQYLSSEELAIYYAFFSILALKSLLEAGVGNVLRRYYAYSNNDTEISAYFKFSIYWYSLISIIFFISTFFGGIWYFSSYKGDIEWEIPWMLTVSIISIRIFLLIFDSYLDGNQKQIDYRVATLISLIINTVTLLLSLYSNLGLLSIFISQLFSTISYIIYLILRRKSLFTTKWDFSVFGFFIILKKLWPLLSKTFIVWFVGYFFWNGFNLISFKVLDIETAGLIGFSLALAKAGYDVAFSIFINQSTLISYYISQKQGELAVSLFKKYSIISMVMLLLGFSLFLLFKIYGFNLSVFTKTVNSYQLFWIFCFYILVLIKSLIHNFVRCFNIEPFVIHVCYNAIIIPTSFYFSIKFGTPWFLAPFCLLIPMLVNSIYILNKKLVLLHE